MTWMSTVRAGRFRRPATLYKALAGLTLAELLATLAIASILLFIALPSYRNLTASSRQTAQINRLVSILHFARSEAVKRGTNVLICKTAACDGGGEWHNGWLVFADRDGSGSQGATEPTLAVEEPWSGAHLAFSAFYNGGDYVLYRPTGFCLTNGTFTHCDERGTDSARAVIISPTGRIRVQDKTAGGAPLTCP